MSQLKVRELSKRYQIGDDRHINMNSVRLLIQAEFIQAQGNWYSTPPANIQNFIFTNQNQPYALNKEEDYFRSFISTGIINMYF